MGGRIHDHAMNRTIAPAQRRDRSLDATIGVHPESCRDDDLVFGTWTIEPWIGWPNGWQGCPGQIFGGQGNDQDLGPYFKGCVWTSDLKFSGGKQAPYTIKGLILDQNGNPVSGATVQLVYVSVPVNWQGMQNDIAIVAATTVSDATGFYGFYVNDNTTKYKVRAHSQSGGGVSSENLVGS